MWEGITYGSYKAQKGDEPLMVLNFSLASPMLHILRLIKPLCLEEMDGKYLIYVCVDKVGDRPRESPGFLLARDTEENAPISYPVARQR